MLDAPSTSSSPPCPKTLPSLDKSGISAPILTLKANRPVGLRKALDAWLRLQPIECIDVVPVEGAATNDAVYAIHVYLRQTVNRIPTNYQHTCVATLELVPKSSLRADAMPDMRVVRTFTELETLRQNVRNAVRHYLPVYCRLCDGLTIQMLTTLAQPKLLTETIYRSRARRAKMMCAFLTHVLDKLHAKKGQCVPACKGQTQLPILLHGFLFEDEGETIGNP